MSCRLVTRACDSCRLKGQFSRVDYAKALADRRNVNAVSAIPVFIPDNAYDVYFNDRIGNVSTSSIVPHPLEQAISVLQLRPRYPIAGGWNYSWFHGYNLPAYDFVHRLPNNQYQLQIPFDINIPQSAIKHYKLRIRLPEGASDIHVDYKVNDYKISHDTYFAYFDTLGRPEVVIERNNTVAMIMSDIVVTYTFPMIYLWRKPITVSAVLFALFVVAIIVGRIDFTLKRTKKVKREVKQIC